MKLSDKTFENLEEMDDFPVKCVLPKLTQEERKGKLKYISYHKRVQKKTLKDVPLKKPPRTDGFPAEVYVT